MGENGRRKKSEVQHRDGFSCLMLAIPLIFYLFFALWDRAVLMGDSLSYIGMNVSREPLYPLFLCAHRAVFGFLGEDAYLFAAVISQSLLAAVADWSLACYLRRKFSLSRGVSILVLLVPLAVSLLCRFATMNSVVYSNSIMSEGITIPLYLMFFRFLLGYLFETGKEKTRCLQVCCALSFLLTASRKQLAVSLLLLAVCIVAENYGKRGFLRGAYAAGVCCIAVLAGTVLLDIGYNFVLRGDAGRHTGDGRFFTTQVFYTSERDDASYIRDEGIRELFLDIYDQCDSQGYLMPDMRLSWYGRVRHYIDHYDHIQLNTMYPAVNAYASAEYEGADALEVGREAGRIMGEINRAVAPRNIGKLFRVFTDNFLFGMVTTVSKAGGILTWYGLCVYLLFIGLLLLHVVFYRKEGEDGRQCDRRLIQAAAIVLLSAVSNAALVSMMIFAQSRYVIYNMAPFYIILVLFMDSAARKLARRHYNGQRSGLADYAAGSEMNG